MGKVQQQQPDSEAVTSAGEGVTSEGGVSESTPSAGEGTQEGEGAEALASCDDTTTTAMDDSNREGECVNCM